MEVCMEVCMDACMHACMYVCIGALMDGWVYLSALLRIDISMAYVCILKYSMQFVHIYIYIYLFIYNC